MDKFEYDASRVLNDKELKQPRQTEFGDPQITAIKHAVEVLQVLSTDAFVHKNETGRKALQNAIDYLNGQLGERISDPEKLSL